MKQLTGKQKLRVRELQLAVARAEIERLQHEVGVLAAAGAVRTCEAELKDYALCVTPDGGEIMEDLKVVERKG